MTNNNAVTQLSQYPTRDAMNAAMRNGASVEEITAAVNRNNELRTMPISRAELPAPIQTKQVVLQFAVSVLVMTAYLTVWSNKLAKALVPGTRNSLLSNPSKMPGKAFGLPAHKACPRKKGTICQSCYAGKGCYAWKSSQAAQKARFEWTRDCMRTDAGMLLWVSVMVQAIIGETYFRIHDSGDFFNARYAKAWVMVCQSLPATKFWAPTRAYQGGVMGLLPVYDPLLNTLRALASLPNVTVRPSALDFGDMPPVVAGLHAGSTADMSDATKAYQCPAKALYKGHCGPCRTCWDDKSTPVNYPKH